MTNSKKFRLGINHFWSYVSNDANGESQVTYIVNGGTVNYSRFSEMVIESLADIQALAAVVEAVKTFEAE